LHRGVLVRSLNHVACVTRDLDALIAFYADVFDATAERFDPSHAFVHVGDGTVLHVFERPEVAEPADPAPFRHGPIDHLAFEATDEGAFVAARQRLVERGAAAPDVTDFGSLVSVRFEDPDGLLHELALWKTADWSPRFATVPFRGTAGGGADAQRN
jgi:catechol 2,3-dioxygenase-like lactoylglutathione lyase family enzyme